MQEPTGPMRMEMVTAGFYESEAWGKKYPMIQLITVAELLDGHGIYIPPIRQVGSTFKKTQRVATEKDSEQEKLGL